MKVDMTKKPTTPREASLQSENYVSRLEGVEAELKSETQELKLQKFQAEKYGVINAETLFKFADTICNELEEIKRTDDPYIQRSLWEDLINLTSRVQFQSGNYEDRTGEVLLWNFLLDDYFEKLVDTIGEGIRGMSSELKVKSIKVEDMVEKIIMMGLGEGGAFNSENAYRKLMMTPLAQFLEYPGYDTLSTEMWQKISDSIEHANELRSHAKEGRISQGLSNFLTALADDFLNEMQHRLVKASETLQERKELTGLDDLGIAKRARMIIDEAQQPLLQEAREHAQRNLSLLRSAALAEAALDGVNIRRTSSRKS